MIMQPICKVMRTQNEKGKSTHDNTYKGRLELGFGLSTFGEMQSINKWNYKRHTNREDIITKNKGMC